MPGGALAGAVDVHDAKQPVVAWALLNQGAEQWTDVPYRWLGRADVAVTIDVPPVPAHVLELSWGSKNDAREAELTINGKKVVVRHQGRYSGFRWLAVAMPKGVAGSRYEITLKRAGGTPAFLAGLRLLAPKGGAPAIAPAERKKPTYRATVKITGNAMPSTGRRGGGGEAFPEMRAAWDTPLPAPAKPQADPALEAAFRKAEVNGRLGAEGLYRCRRFVDGWLAQADPKTGLIPRNLTSGRSYWNAQDSAADNYPFMVLTCALTDRKLFEGRMLDMLRTETKLTSRVGRLPDTYSFTKQGFQSDKVNMPSIIFGGSEYVKDGLLPLTEWLGPSPWRDRMIGIVDDLWKHAEVDTPYGKIPTTNIEVHGEMCQALSRIYWMTGQEKYLDWAVRLADYYLLDEKNDLCNATGLRLRDHGCEIVSGLSEVYAACHFARPEKKKAYAKAIHAIFDRILEIGRDERGMLYNSVNMKTGTHGRGICDTWGYNYNGVYTVYLLDKTDAYRQAVRHVLGNLKEHITPYNWGSADEFADSIEGAINLYNREPVASAAEWIDSEIRDMWAKQRPDGVIEGWHGDGNSARTTIMYVTWKSQGTTVQPWRKDVRAGAVMQDGKLCVSLVAGEADWKGTLVFDAPRHKTQLKMPLDYPRINQFPEWFTVEAGAKYTVQPVGAEAKTHPGAALREGLPVELKASKELRLIVTPPAK